MEREYKCLHCGQSLTAENCRNNVQNISGYSHYCINCEQKFYDKLAEAEGKSLALFHCCAAFNVPCMPLALENFDIDNSTELWIDYITLLDQYCEEEGISTADTFFDGTTNLLRIFGREMSQKDFAACIKHERDKLNKLPGTSAQRARWGTKDGFTTEDYDALDAAYNNRIESYRGQEMTGQMKDVLRQVVKWNHLAENLIRLRQYDGAKKLIDMADKQLASENMRRKDEKPLEAYSIDSQVIALERAGIMEEGKFVTFDKLMDVLKKNFFGKKKFDYSIDVADHMLEAIDRTMRANAELFIPSELPEDMEMEDEFGEFESEETEDERENKKFAGMTKISYIPRDVQDQESASDK